MDILAAEGTAVSAKRKVWDLRAKKCYLDGRKVAQKQVGAAKRIPGRQSWYFRRGLTTIEDVYTVVGRLDDVILQLKVVQLAHRVAKIKISGGKVHLYGPSTLLGEGHSPQDQCRNRTGAIFQGKCDRSCRLEGNKDQWLGLPKHQVHYHCTRTSSLILTIISRA